MVGIPKDALFYYTHSYHLDVNNKSEALGFSNYGYDFVAGIEKDNIFGVQFHPEKSQNWGLQILNNFGQIANSC
jgi:glutamine amidotransferase